MTALLLISAVGTQPLHLLASRSPSTRQSSGPRNGKIKGWGVGRVEQRWRGASTRPGREYKQQIPPSQLPNPAFSRYMTSEVCVSQSSSSLILSPLGLSHAPKLPSPLLGLLRCVLTAPPSFLFFLQFNL